MVQIIPREPGLAELLGAGIGQGFMGERQRQQSLRDKLLQDEQAMQRQLALQQQKSQYDLASKLALERQKASDRSSLLGQLGFGGGYSENQPQLMDMLSGNEPYGPVSIPGMQPTNRPVGIAQEQPQMQGKGGSPFENISDSQLAGLAVQFPQLASLIQKQREQQQAQQRYEEQKKLEKEKFENQKKEFAWNYGPVKKYIEDLQERVDSARMQLDVADEIEEVLNTGKVGPGNPRAFLASRYGESLPFLFDENTSKLKLLEKLQAKGLKEYFPRPTEKEFFFINAAQAQLGKTDEANRAVINLQRKFAKIPIKAAEFKDQIIKENGGYPPLELQLRVNEKMDEYKKSMVKDSALLTYKYGDKKEKSESLAYLKQNIGKDKILVRMPNGSVGTIPKENLKQALSQGAEEL